MRNCNTRILMLVPNECIALVSTLTLRQRCPLVEINFCCSQADEICLRLHDRAII